ncbi:hypothetical protein P879_07102 [Paragonimus westermani]|uniref:H15 domain-containing protein n=1 Tax=Paragonimus westermani TaxID=34504 RepID=A0A8T0DA77_9TREM|nr:hypothetical protein P879_07102 [Paragonimus westermani]
MATVAAPKTTKAKKAPANHPPYFDMIKHAIKELKERNGSSRQAIAKYVKAHYKVDDKADHHLKRTLVSAVKAGRLLHTKGIGASGSFKIAEKTTVKAAAKPKVAKKPKTPKKSVNKKPKVVKPASAKKPKTSKPKATKPKKVKTPKKTVKTLKPKKPVAKKTPKKAASSLHTQLLLALGLMLESSEQATLAPYGVYAGVQPAVVICVGLIGTVVLVTVVSLMALSLVKSRRRQAQRILGRRERQKWLIGLHGRMAAGSRFTPFPTGSSVDLSDLAEGSVGQLTPHRLYLSKETLDPANYSHTRQGSHAAIVSITTTHGYHSNGSNVSVSLSKSNPYQWWEHDYSEPRPPPLVGAGIEPQDLDVGQSLLGVSVALHNGAGNRIIKPQRRSRRTALDGSIPSSLRATNRLDESRQHKDSHSTFGKHPQSSHNSLVGEPYQGEVHFDRYNSYAAELNYADQRAEVHRGRRADVERSVVPDQSTTRLSSFSNLQSKKRGQEVSIVRPNSRPRPTSGQHTSIQNDSDSDYWDDEF